MNDQKLQQKLINYLQDAHAMEQNVSRMLDAMILCTKDTETRRRLEQHRTDTERHEQLLRTRLKELGQNVSWTADVSAMAGAVLKGVADQIRSDKPGKNARDAFVSEQAEIATYELLERFALRAGDHETARLARIIRTDEEQMAHWIAAHWDRSVDLTLEEAGIHPQSPFAGSRGV